MPNSLKEQVEHTNNDLLPPHQLKDSQFTAKTGHSSDIEPFCVAEHFAFNLNVD